MKLHKQKALPLSSQELVLLLEFQDPYRQTLQRKGETDENTIEKIKPGRLIGIRNKRGICKFSIETFQFAHRQLYTQIVR